MRVYKDHFDRPFKRGDWVLYAQAIYRSASIRVARVKGFYLVNGLKVTEVAPTDRWDHPTQKYISAGMKIWNCAFKVPENCVIIDPNTLPLEYIEAYKDWKPDPEPEE